MMPKTSLIPITKWQIYKTQQLFVPFHNLNFLAGEVVEFIDEAVNFFVGGVDLALDYGFVLLGLGRLKLFVKREHLINKRNHLFLRLMLVINWFIKSYFFTFPGCEIAGGIKKREIYFIFIAFVKSKSP